MSNYLPTGPVGRLLALGLVLFVLATAWIGGAGPLIAWHAERADRLDQRRILAGRMASIAAEVTELQQKVGAATDHAQAASALLQGGTDAVAGAALQTAVEQMARSAGVSITSVETLPGESAGAYRKIGLRMVVNAPWPSLIKMLRSF